MLECVHIYIYIYMYTYGERYNPRGFKGRLAASPKPRAARASAPIPIM